MLLEKSRPAYITYERETKMLIAFTLSMPNVGSWNGKWTGAGQVRAIIVNIGSKKRAKQIIDNSSYSYNFGDGWRASINAEKVDAKEARRLRKASVGFCGYEWMIDSIRADLEIIVPSSRNT